MVIDDFVTQQTVDVSSAAPASGGGVANTLTALGTERDLYVEKTFGPDGERVRARANPLDENLLRQSVDSARGRTVVTWDGVDGNAAPGAVDYDGLGGLDFLLYDTLELMVDFSDLAGPVRFTFWSAADLTGSTYATTTFTVPGGLAPGSATLLSKSLSTDDFALTGGGFDSIFGNVGAIQMSIDATAVAQTGWDSGYDFVRLSGPDAAVPLPAPVLLSIAGLAALAGVGMRRRPA